MLHREHGGEFARIGSVEDFKQGALEKARD
jgi:hypothetical protein